MNMQDFNQISEEQSKKNYIVACDALNQCKTWRDLAQVRSFVITAQQKPNGNFFFPKGKSKEFWNAYHVKKAEIAASTDQQGAA